MKVTTGPVPHADALRFADEAETALSEVAAGTRKAGKIPLEPICRLIQYARTSKRSVPDWEAVRGKRMSELTPAQQDDAEELWIRDHVGYFTESVEFLLRRLDAARGAK